MSRPEVALLVLVVGLISATALWYTITLRRSHHATVEATKVVREATDVLPPLIAESRGALEELRKAVREIQDVAGTMQRARQEANLIRRLSKLEQLLVDASRLRIAVTQSDSGGGDSLPAIVSEAQTALETDLLLLPEAELPRCREVVQRTGGLVELRRQRDSIEEEVMSRIEETRREIADVQIL